MRGIVIEGFIDVDSHLGVFSDDCGETSAEGVSVEEALEY